MAPIINKKLCENQAHKVREEDNGEEYYCDGCKTNGKGRKYICQACNGYFHHECNDFKPKFCPEMFKEEKGSYEFEFTRSLPPPRKKNCLGHRNCEACGMQVEGYAYCCKKTDKVLHPPCAFLGKEILVPPDDPVPPDDNPGGRVHLLISSILSVMFICGILHSIVYSFVALFQR